MNGTLPEQPYYSTPDELAREVNHEIAFSEAQDQMLEERVAALEAIVAARWPARIAARRRMRRQLRASVAGYGWVGRDWADRRAQAIGDGWPAR